MNSLGRIWQGKTDNMILIQRAGHRHMFFDQFVHFIAVMKVAPIILKLLVTIRYTKRMYNGSGWTCESPGPSEKCTNVCTHLLRSIPPLMHITTTVRVWWPLPLSFSLTRRYALPGDGDVRREPSSSSRKRSSPSQYLGRVEMSGFT